MHLAEDCELDYREVLKARLGVIEAARSGDSTPFYRMLVFWLTVIFLSFGLIAPRHSLSVVTIGLCAFSLSSAIFIITDLSHPYDGLFAVSSATMRNSLALMMAP